MNALLHILMAMSPFLLMFGLIWFASTNLPTTLIGWPLESIVQRIRIWVLGRKVRGLRVGVQLYSGGTERNRANHETRRATVRIIRDLRKLGVTVVSLHRAAAASLRRNDVWRDRLAEHDGRKLDLVIVGDWLCWVPMSNPGLKKHHSLQLRAYTNNGAQLRLGDGQIETPIYGGQRQRIARLHRQGLQTILCALDLAHRQTHPAPQFYYDTSEWPFDQAATG